ncbi:MAG: N-acetyl-alpha-D-glucosaminyl L-malate synthase BshA [Myxococcaceae bacterium]
MKPLSVGIACFPTVGGSGVAASQLALKLAALGHSVHVFSSGLPVRLANNAGACVLHRIAPVTRPPLENGVYALALAGKMADVAARERLDVFHVHYALPHAASALLAQDMVARQGGRPPRLVTTLHGTDVTGIVGDPALTAVTRHALLRSDAVTTPSAWLRRTALENLSLPEATQVEVLPNFVDPAEFHPGDDRPALRGLFPALAWEGPVRPGLLLHASNFRAVKRVGDAVLALAEVLRTRPAALVLVGDGPERPSVEKLTASLGLTGHVAFLGEQLQMGRLLAQADLFVLPSEQESFGLAALEALASGVPVVATRVGGVPEVVRHSETGLLVPARDPKALASAVLDLLGEEPRRSAMGRAAREDALARFRPEPVVARVEALYHRVLAAG